jgi:hypothetical protein
MPAAASHLGLRRDTAYRAFKLDLMRIESGLLAEITTFDAKLFPAFGLAPSTPRRPMRPGTKRADKPAMYRALWEHQVAARRADRWLKVGKECRGLEMEYDVR